MSPSRMPAPIIESPLTRRAKLSSSVANEVGSGRYSSTFSAAMTGEPAEIRPTTGTDPAWPTVAIKHLFGYGLVPERTFAHTGAMGRTDVRQRQRSLRRRRRLARTLVVATVVTSGLGFLAGHATAGASRPTHHPVHLYVV